MKKYTVEYFKASEVEREAKLPAYWKYCFADDIKVQSDYDWMKYFYDLGYRGEVRVLIDH